MKRYIFILLSVVYVFAAEIKKPEIKKVDNENIDVVSISKAKRALVTELLNLVNAKQQAEDILESMIKMLPMDVRESIRSSLDADEMVNQIVPVYEKYLSAEDLRSIISFYHSPAGKKLLRTQPKIIKDSMIVMKVYAQRKFSETIKSEKETK